MIERNKMNKRYEDVLRVVYDRFIEIGRVHVTEIQTGVEGDNRKEICQWLVQNGYIENVYYYGREYIACDITDKAIDYFSA